MVRFFAAVSLFVVFSTGCDGNGAVWGMPDGTEAPLVARPGEAAVLELLNDAETTHGRLDQDVRLDRRAASHLMAHRNGLDGVYGTDDDNLFGSLDEVEAVPFVGPASIERMRAYAEASGFGE